MIAADWELFVRHVQAEPAPPGGKDEDRHVSAEGAALYPKMRRLIEVALDGREIRRAITSGILRANQTLYGVVGFEKEIPLMELAHLYAPQEPGLQKKFGAFYEEVDANVDNKFGEVIVPETFLTHQRDGETTAHAQEMRDKWIWASSATKGTQQGGVGITVGHTPEIELLLSELFPSEREDRKSTRLNSSH